MTDAESFPLEAPLSPRLASKGAFAEGATYSIQDLDKLTEFASDRGVKLILEVNSPGHSASWAKGYSEVMSKCFQKYSYNINDFALNPTKERTFRVVEGAYAAAAAGSFTHANPSWLHLGGDEVVYGCWAEDSSIQQYCQDQGIPSWDALLGSYINRVQSIALNQLGASHVLHWEDVFQASRSGAQGALDAFQFSPNTIFQCWRGDGALLASITAANYSAIASPDSYWYLDHATTWDQMYYYDPKASLPSQQQRSKLIGGEAVMFGEKVDQANMQQRTQPRAACVAERLWSDRSAQPDDVDGQGTTDKESVGARLGAHVCRLRARGVQASPIAPSFCDGSYV